MTQNADIIKALLDEMRYMHARPPGTSESQCGDDHLTWNRGYRTAVEHIVDFLNEKYRVALLMDATLKEDKI